MPVPVNPISATNIAAWNSLYRETPDLVWGAAPVDWLADALAPVVPLLPASGVVLDAAAGEGRNLRPLLALGREVVACDAAAAGLEKIPSDLAPAPLPLVCDLAAVPLPDAGVAFILMSDIVETLPEPGPVLREMRRLLVPGGLLLANVPDHDDGVSGRDMAPLDPAGFLYLDRYYFHFYTQAEAERLARDAGFAIIDSRPVAWDEPSHPDFRDHPHRHRSRLLLLRKPVEA